MFVLKSTHDKIVAAEVAKIWVKAKADRDLDQRALDAERAITASLRKEIEAMKPDWQFGIARRAQNKKATAVRQAKREAARAGL